MNHYTVYSAERSVPASARDAKALKRLLAQSDGHGFEVEAAKEGIYLFAGDGREDDLPRPFLRALGKILKKAGLPFLRVGYACTADREAAGSQGGGEFRIHQDGKIESPVLFWPRSGK